MWWCISINYNSKGDVKDITTCTHNLNIIQLDADIRIKNNFYEISTHILVLDRKS